MAAPPPAACGLAWHSASRQQLWGNNERPRWNAGEPETGDENLGRNGGWFRLPAAGPGEQANDLFRPNARRAQGADPRVTVALRQPPAIGPDDQGDMGEGRRGQAERTVQKQLPWCRRNEIIAAKDEIDAVIRVIDDYGELVRRRVLRFPNDEVAADVVAGEGNRAPERIVVSRRVCGAESPSERLAEQSGGVGDTACRTGAGIDDLGPIRMGGTGGLLDVGPCAGAGIDKFSGFKPGQGGFVMGKPFGLDDRVAVPIQAEPAEVSQGLLGGAGFDARRVDVLDPENDPPTSLPGHEPGDQVGAGIAEMLGTRRGRGQPRDEWG